MRKTTWTCDVCGKGGKQSEFKSGRLIFMIGNFQAVGTEDEPDLCFNCAETVTNSVTRAFEAFLKGACAWCGKSDGTHEAALHNRAFE